MTFAEMLVEMVEGRGAASARRLALAAASLGLAAAGLLIRTRR
jgi:hypothetical protein